MSKLETDLIKCAMKSWDGRRVYQDYLRERDREDLIKLWDTRPKVFPVYYPNWELLDTDIYIDRGVITKYWPKYSGYRASTGKNVNIPYFGTVPQGVIYNKKRR